MAILFICIIILVSSSHSIILFLKTYEPTLYIGDANGIHGISTQQFAGYRALVVVFHLTDFFSTTKAPPHHGDPETSQDTDSVFNAVLGVFMETGGAKV